MPHIDWALMCDLAFFDRSDRLCVMGVIRQLPTPTLPLALGQVMMVGHLACLTRSDTVAVSVGVETPSGSCVVPRDGDSLVIELARDYVLVTLRDVPLREPGTYRFHLAVNDRPPATLDIPVLPLH